MKITDLHDLPKLRDGLGYCYVEHAKIEQEMQSICVFDADGQTAIPAAALAVLLVGPGTTITHAAVKTLADNGCSILWCGEGATRCYAQGMGETRKAYKLRRQAELVTDPKTRAEVVMRMYRMRFSTPLPKDMSIEQLRGMEGVRVRETYAKVSRNTGVPWHGRSWNKNNWSDADPVNRALSAANSCLYGVCHAAIVSSGYSTGLGFIHSGKQLSFVYDIADLYKADVTIPAAFDAASVPDPKIETRVRHFLRDEFYRQKILARIVSDIDRALDIRTPLDETRKIDHDAQDAIPAELWDPEKGAVSGGVNYGGDHPGKSPTGSQGSTEPVDD